MTSRRTGVVGVVLAFACTASNGCAAYARDDASPVVEHEAPNDHGAGAGGGAGTSAGADAGSLASGTGGEDGPAGAGGQIAMPVDASVRDDAGEPPVILDALPTGEPACSQWASSLAAINERDTAKLGLFVADSVIEGTLGPLETHADVTFAKLHVTRVHHGWSFMAGSDVLIELEAERHAALGEGNDVLLGLGSPGQRPMLSEQAPGQIAWGPVLGAARASELADFEPIVGYRAWRAKAGVAVMRVVALDSARVHLSLVETLAGTVPVSVQENWPAEWGLPYPAASNDEYIVSFSWITSDFGTLGSVTDFRPNSADEHDEVVAALARMQDETSPERQLLASIEAGAAAADTAQTAWLYHQAAMVARVEVSGTAPRCCNAIDRIYAQNDVLEAFKVTERERVITLGDFREDHCGDRFIYALAEVPEAEPAASEAMVCEGTSSTSFQLESGFAEHWHRMPDTDDDAAAVRRWVDSASPLYTMHLASEDLSAVRPARPVAGAQWSAPFSADVALRSGELIDITVEAVTERADGYEVELSTSFGPVRSPSVPVERFKLYFECGDERLLQVGAKYLAVMMANDARLGTPLLEQVERGDAFLVPGLLLPQRTGYWLASFQLSLDDE